MVGRILSGIGAIAILAAAAPAQRNKLPKYKLDPYTRNAAQALSKLGYLGYGPFEFGQRGAQPTTTDQIEAVVPDAELIWVETPHFRIGSSLDKWTVPSDRTTRLKLRAELERLKQRGLNRVNPRTRTLDRWLRLHLIAQRMEELYAEIQHWLGVTDDDFPEEKSRVKLGEGPYMGFGKFLGQPGKYLILLFEDESNFNRFLTTFIGRDTRYGQRWNFKQVGSLLYTVPTNGKNDRRHDTAIHQDLRYNVTTNLIDGFRFYAYDLPVWIRIGIAHYFGRLVEPPKWNTFDQNEGTPQSDDRRWKWKTEAKKLIANDRALKFSEAFSVRDVGRFAPDDHIACWSRMDFLLSMGQPKFAAFLRLVKGRVHPENWQANADDLVGATRDALQQVYGMTPLTLDDKWAAWVKRSY